MFSGNTKFSSYCLHYFTVSSYSYCLHDDCIFGWIFSVDQSQTPKSTRHITGAASDSRHSIFVNLLCVVQNPKIHYHTLTLKTFPLRFLAQFRSTLQLAARKKPAKNLARFDMFESSDWTQWILLLRCSECDALQFGRLVPIASIYRVGVLFTG